MFLSIRLSSGEKPDSPGLMTSRMSLRSARTVLGFQPNNARNAAHEPASAAFRRGRHGYRQIARLEWRAGGARTGWIAVRHGGHASSESRAT